MEIKYNRHSSNDPHWEVLSNAELPESTELSKTRNGFCYEPRLMQNDQVPGSPVHFPSRWGAAKYNSTVQAKSELGKLAECVTAGTRAIVGVYMRICDVIRANEMTDEEVREALLPTFPPPRVAEILRVSRAPRDVYDRYTAGFFSFKAVVQKCRLYHITPSPELHQRNLRKVADRLVSLMGGPGEIRIKDRLVRVE